MPRCPICLNKHTKLFHKISGYSYFSCSKCLTLFIHPKPKLENINKYYSNNFKYTAGEFNENSTRERAKKILKKLLKFNPTGKTLLDIGSGYGFFLDEAKSQGLQPLGLEPSKELVQSIKRLDCKVINTDFEGFYRHNKKERFDFIVIIHTIEHVHNPKVIIKNSLKLLKKNGILYLETPNLDSHLFYSEEKKYTFLTPPDHLWLFSLKSFSVIFKNISETKIKKFSTYSQSEHLMGILKRNLKKKQTNLSLDESVQSLPRSFQFNVKLERIKILILDKILARIFTPILNLNHKGSILELYISKK